MEVQTDKNICGDVEDIQSSDDQQSTVYEESHPGSKFLGFINLSSNTSALNFVAFLVASLLVIAIFVFLNGTQPYVLSYILKVPEDQSGNENSNLVLYDQILSIVMLGTWGSLSDRIGRRVIFSLGFLIMGVAICLYPQATSLYPSLLLLRLTFGIGASASSTMITGVLADYVGEGDKGKVSGCVGLFSGLGAMLGAFVFMALPQKFLASSNNNNQADQQGNEMEAITNSLKYSFLVVGVISLVTGVLLMFTLKPHRNDFGFLKRIFSPATNYGTDSNQEQRVEVEVSNEDVQCPVSAKEPLLISKREERLGCTMVGALEQESLQKRPFWALVLEGFKLGLKKPHILLAYLGGFTARGDSMIITLFLPLWVNKYYRQNNLCGVKPAANGLNINQVSSSSAPPFMNDLKQCGEAFTKASIYSGIAQTCALIGAPLFGFLADRFSKSAVFTVAALISCAAYSSLFFVDNPLQKAVYILMPFVGLSEIGLIVTSLSLATSGVPADIRGSVAGCYSLFGGLGILFLSKVGGILFDVWKEGAVFLLVGIVSGFVFIGGVSIMAINRYRSRQSVRI
ncbi:hypothetical protein MP228_000286 [Amoeboaphelidium protococcarum]|nr:hypothetical protein MP228_000286 [Amoeboaphelidium protococcarum]